MGNSYNNLRNRNYSQKQIKISLNLPAESNEQAPHNLYESNEGALLRDAFSGLLEQKRISNYLAAKLVIDAEEETKLPIHSEAFQRYHKACVQVIATNDDGRPVTGSGILVEHSEMELLLITSAHVITNTNCSVTIALEVDHARTRNRNKAKATRIKINLNGHQISRNANDDVAFIFFDNTSAAGKLVLKHVQEFPSKGFQRFGSDYFMVIHYGNPNSDHKSVSVGERVGTGDHQPLDMSVYLAGGPGASGAPLFNNEGEVVAVLRSKNERFRRQRHFTAFEDIDEENFDADNDCKPRVFEIFEGRKFDETLIENNGDFRQTVFQCLGVGGLYGKTKQYSKKKKIESDHFPPYNAYYMASKYENCPAVVKSILTGGGDRPGENNLPAIIIPKVIHGELATTGRSDESVEFRKKQAKYISRSGKFWRAIKKNFDDYVAKGLFRRSNYPFEDQKTFDELMEKYIQGFKDALKEHRSLRLIDEEREKWLGGYITKLEGESHDSGDQLELDDIISLFVE